MERKVKDLTRISCPQIVGWTATNSAKTWWYLSARSERRTQQLLQRTAPLWDQCPAFAHWEPKTYSMVSRLWEFFSWNKRRSVLEQGRLTHYSFSSGWPWPQTPPSLLNFSSRPRSCHKSQQVIDWAPTPVQILTFGQYKVNARLSSFIRKPKQQ
jgi:hypothetical protein